MGDGHGLAGSTEVIAWIEEQREPTRVDLASIAYSMPTVAADALVFAMPTQASFEGAPQLHEDEWCQIEFLPRDAFAAI